MATSLDGTDLASATLLVLSGPVRGSRIEVPAGGLLFGRAAGSVGQLGDDQALSRWHARLDFADEVLVVEDLASTNGTFLNGQRISGRQPVRPGDVVTFGNSQLQALSPPTAAPAQLRMQATGLLPALAAASPAPAAAHPAPAPAAAHLAPAPAPTPAAAHPAPAPARLVPAPSRSAAPAQPGLPPVPGSWGLVELSSVQPSFIALVGRYLGRVTRGYLVLVVLLGVLAILLQVARSHLTLPTAVTPGQWAKPVAGLLALSGVVWALVAYLRSAGTRLSLHPGRLDIDRGLLRREATVIDLRRLRRVTLDQTALQRLTGDGTLLLEFVDGADSIPVTGIARGQKLHQIYRQLTALTPASHR